MDIARLEQLRDELLRNRKALMALTAGAVLMMLSKLGRKDAALHYLERGYREHVPALVRLQQDPYFFNLHSDPKFRAIASKIGLPEL